MDERVYDPHFDCSHLDHCPACAKAENYLCEFHAWVKRKREWCELIGWVKRTADSASSCSEEPK